MKTDDLADRIRNIEPDITTAQAKQFLKYYELLVEWNKVMNLTAITEYEEVVQKHFVDSLMIAKTIDIKAVGTVIDVGTGAGFPGIPLKIAYPHLKITLLDSLNKRIRFLNAVTDELRLDSVTAIHDRAEDLARKKEHREAYDLCVSRAVANLSALSEYCLPYVKVGGYFVAYKSGNVEQELKEAGIAVRILGGEIKKVERFVLPHTDIQRSLILIEKTKNTGKRFPRKAGTPAKEPLK